MIKGLDAEKTICLKPSDLCAKKKVEGVRE